MPKDPITGVFVHDELGTHLQGPLVDAVDRAKFLSPQCWAKDSLNLVLTRNAAFDWSWNRTSGGAETYNLFFQIPKLTFDQKRDLELFLVYQIGVAALTSNAVVVKSTVFANATAPAVATTVTPGGTTLATAAAATPYVTRVTIPPTIIGPNLSLFHIFSVEWTLVMANTGTLHIYGAFLRQPE